MPDPSAASARPLVGIEIGGTKLQMVTGDHRGVIHHTLRDTVDRAAGGEGIRQRLVEMFQELAPDSGVEAVGVGFGGPVNHLNGDIARSHQIEGWSGFPLATWLSDLTGARVVVQNDANVAALAEAHIGAGKGRDPVFYITLGSGVGGGLVRDGHIYLGACPGESEIGHLRLLRTGERVEERCSGWAVDSRIRQQMAKHPESKLTQRVRDEPGAEARHLSSALQDGDAWAHQILTELGQDLGLALSHVVHLMHPELILLGGGLSKLGEPLRCTVETELRNHVMEVFQSTIQVKLGTLQDAVVPSGALIMAGQSQH